MENKILGKFRTIKGAGASTVWIRRASQVEARLKKKEFVVEKRTLKDEILRVIHLVNRLGAGGFKVVDVVFGEKGIEPKFDYFTQKEVDVYVAKRNQMLRDAKMDLINQAVLKRAEKATNGEVEDLNDQDEEEIIRLCQEKPLVPY